MPNVRKLGLLDANNGYLRQQWGEAGLLEFEFADDTGSDYETYDEVARDRTQPRRSAGAAEGGGNRGAAHAAPGGTIRCDLPRLPEAGERPFGGHTAPASASATSSSS